MTVMHGVLPITLLWTYYTLELQGKICDKQILTYRMIFAKGVIFSILYVQQEHLTFLWETLQLFQFVLNTVVEQISHMNLTIFLAHRRFYTIPFTEFT